MYAALSVPDIIAQRVSAPSALYAFVIAALVVGLIGTPLAIWAARRLGIVDRPGGRRIHAKPVPLLGGVAIMFGIVVAVTLNLPFTRDDYGAIVIGADPDLRARRRRRLDRGVAAAEVPRPGGLRDHPRARRASRSTTSRCR